MFSGKLLKEFPTLTSIASIANGLNPDSGQLLSIVIIDEGASVLKAHRTLKPGTYAFLSHGKDCWSNPSNFSRVHRTVERAKELIRDVSSEYTASELVAGSVAFSLASHNLLRRDVDALIADSKEDDVDLDDEDVERFFSSVHDIPVLLMLFANHGPDGQFHTNPLGNVSIIRFVKGERGSGFRTATMGEHIVENAREYFSALDARAAFLGVDGSEDPDESGNDSVADSEEPDLDAFFAAAVSKTKH